MLKLTLLCFEFMSLQSSIHHPPIRRGFGWTALGPTRIAQLPERRWETCPGQAVGSQMVSLISKPILMLSIPKDGKHVLKSFRSMAAMQPLPIVS